jgi:hypothetical protein
MEAERLSPGHQRLEGVGLGAAAARGEIEAVSHGRTLRQKADMRESAL